MKRARIIALATLVILLLAACQNQPDQSTLQPTGKWDTTRWNTATWE